MLCISSQKSAKGRISHQRNSQSDKSKAVKVSWIFAFVKLDNLKAKRSSGNTCENPPKHECISSTAGQSKECVCMCEENADKKPT